MTSILTEDEIIGIADKHEAALGGVWPHEFAEAIIDATIKRLAAGVSVEPVAYTDPLFVSVRQLGGFFTASNDKVGMFTVPLYTASAIAAARLQMNERIVKLCKKRWKGGYPQEVIDDLVTAIHALLGAKT